MIRLPPIADCRLQIAAAVEASALGTGSELIVLVFEQDVERGERSAGRWVNRNSWIVNRGTPSPACRGTRTGKLISTEARHGRHGDQDG